MSLVNLDFTDVRSDSAFLILISKFTTVLVFFSNVEMNRIFCLTSVVVVVLNSGPDVLLLLIWSN